jgi:hypothetical protein
MPAPHPACRATAQAPMRQRRTTRPARRPRRATMPALSGPSVVSAPASTAAHAAYTAFDFGDALTFSFDQAITAFGAEFRQLKDNDTRTLADVGGQTLDIPGVPGGSVRSFFGFVSDTPFTSVSFRGVANDVYGIDDVTFGAALRVPAVPEPGSVALLSLGLVGVAVARRRATARAGTASTPV